MQIIPTQHARFLKPFNVATILNFFTPSRHLNITKNIAYGVDARQMLDVYAPKKTGSQDKLPVIVFVHGGSWTHGDKGDYLFLAEGLVGEGFVVVVINYRLAPTHVYPDYVQDTAASIAWTYRHITQFGGDPMRIIAMGHSAGAFNVVAACVNSRWLAAVNVPVASIQHVVGIAGPYSYDFRCEPSKNAFAANATPDLVMPDRQVQAGAPAHVLVVAEKDAIVNVTNSERMHLALMHQGVPSKIVVIGNANHVNVIGSFSSHLRKLNAAARHVLAEIRPQ